MTFITNLIFIMIIFVFLDMIWFTVSVPSIYRPKFTEIQNDVFEPMNKIQGGFFAWLLLALGIQVFVLAIAKNIKEAILYGLLYGLIVYGVYNGTNYTTFTKYNLDIFLPDLLWGCFVCSLVSVISFHFLSKNNN